MERSIRWTWQWLRQGVWVPWLQGHSRRGGSSRHRLGSFKINVWCNAVFSNSLDTYHSKTTKLTVAQSITIRRRFKVPLLSWIRAKNWEIWVDGMSIGIEFRTLQEDKWTSKKENLDELASLATNTGRAALCWQGCKRPRTVIFTVWIWILIQKDQRWTPANDLVRAWDKRKES